MEVILLNIVCQLVTLFQSYNIMVSSVYSIPFTQEFCGDVLDMVADIEVLPV